MNLSRFLKSEHIVIGESPDSKEQALQYLIDILKKDHHELDSARLFNSVYERSNLNPALLENGIFLPHARIPHYNDLTVSVYIPRSPIVDNGKKIRILFLVVTDQMKSNLYLNVMAGIAELGTYLNSMSHPLGSLSVHEFIEFVESCHINIRQVIYVKDIMNTVHPMLPPTASLKEALDTIVQCQKPYIPVCGENNELLGEITIFDIIGVGIPHYTRAFNNLAFLSSLEPLEDMLRKESEIRLSTIMQKPSFFFSQDTIIVEALFQFNKLRYRNFIPVLDDSQFIGVLSSLDLVNNFLRV